MRGTPRQHERFHPERRFGGFTDDDATIRFYARVQELLPRDGVALDVGCGRGAQADDPVATRRELRTLRGKCSFVLGVDVDPAAAANAFVDEFRLIEDAASWPVEPQSVDLALADFVVEHLQAPDLFFREAVRVLRPGGHLCVRTVNAHSYLGLASRLVPNSFHRALLSRAQPEREPGDVFPTLYRCNTVNSLRRHLNAHNLDAVVYGSEAEPAYLAFSAPTYALGLLHRRVAPARLRPGLFAWARKR